MEEILESAASANLYEAFVESVYILQQTHLTVILVFFYVQKGFTKNFNECYLTSSIIGQQLMGIT